MEKKAAADDAGGGSERLQKIADRHVARVDEMAARKEAEIMEV